jgi:alkylation response protein AidB-like acyl-CoA dehydrogenase
MESALSLLAIDHLLTEEERDIRDTVKKLVDEKIKPHVAAWYESGDLPARELAKEFGALGLLGMHLEGYGCAGTNATAYGLEFVRWSLYKVRSLCTPFGDGEAKNRKPNGYLGWRVENSLVVSD